MKKQIGIALSLLFIFATSAMANWVFDPTVFEPTYYADQNKGVRDQIGYDTKKLMEHWGNFGIKEGRRSSPVLDVKYYLKHNPGVAKAVGQENYIKAAEHWYMNGRKEGRPSHPDFEVKEYLRLNQDVAREYGQDNYIKAINHYLQTGFKEGRRAK